MNQINELSANMSPQNFNQMTRWVNTKEKEAQKILMLAADYSLAQRVNPSDAVVLLKSRLRAALSHVALSVISTLPDTESHVPLLTCE